MNSRVIKKKKGCHSCVFTWQQIDLRTEAESTWAKQSKNEEFTSLLKSLKIKSFWPAGVTGNISGSFLLLPFPSSNLTGAGGSALWIQGPSFCCDLNRKWYKPFTSCCRVKAASKNISAGQNLLILITGQLCVHTTCCSRFLSVFLAWPCGGLKPQTDCQVLLEERCPFFPTETEAIRG